MNSRTSVAHTSLSARNSVRTRQHVIYADPHACRAISSPPIPSSHARIRFGSIPGSKIDSTRPFRVTARFPHKKVNWYTPNGAGFEVDITQAGSTYTLLDPSVAGNAPEDDPAQVRLVPSRHSV